MRRVVPFRVIPIDWAFSSSFPSRLPTDRLSGHARSLWPLGNMHFTRPNFAQIRIKKEPKLRYFNCILTLLLKQRKCFVGRRQDLGIAVAFRINREWIWLLFSDLTSAVALSLILFWEAQFAGVSLMIEIDVFRGAFKLRLSNHLTTRSVLPQFTMSHKIRRPVGKLNF